MENACWVTIDVDRNDINLTLRSKSWWSEESKSETDSQSSGDRSG